MLKVVKAKALYDDNVRYYSIDKLDNIQIGEYYVGTTCFGDDLVEIVCHKIVEMAQEQWNSMTNPTVKSHFSFEPKLIRKAIETEIEESKSIVKKANAYKEVFEEKVKEYEIDLKIVNLHYTLAKDRLICTYVAPKRVDFRSFVKDLGHVLKQRIELFQVPATQGFTFIPSQCAMGVCGRQLCCATFCASKANCKKSSGSRSPKNIGCCGHTKCCIEFDQ